LRDFLLVLNTVSLYSDVLQALATGQSNRAIAQQLYLSVATVKVHLKHIYGKLAVTSRTEALAHVRELNLL
jgi:LuxR family transcriptional regulator, maltose regulon positive regulatory protein